MQTIKSTNNPISIPGTSVTKVEAIQGPEINFNISIENIDTRPLPPVAFASYGVDNKIVLSATVLLPKLLVESAKKIVFQINEFRANTNKLHYYLAYEAHPVASNVFYAYNVNFNSLESFPSGEISKVKVILWDEDPEGSRGTETKVKQPS